MVDGGMPDRSGETRAWRRVAYGEIDSTNAEALRRAAAGERGPLWITAASQTQGRGRSGRSWTSAEGSLAATLLFQPECPVTRLPELALVAGVAAHDAIGPVMAPERRAGLRLKWPNDLMIDGAKVSGILVESMSFGTAAIAAIGIGVNVLGLPHLADRAVAAVVGPGSVVSIDGLTAEGLTVEGLTVEGLTVEGLTVEGLTVEGLTVEGLTVEGLAARLEASLAVWLATWDGARNFAEVRSAWLARAGRPGEPLTVNAGDGPIAGTFAGLDSDGALLLDVGQTARRRFTFGDVALGAPQA